MWCVVVVVGPASGLEVDLPVVVVLEIVPELPEI